MSAPLPYPALVANHGGAWIAEPDGSVEALSPRTAIRRAGDTPLLLLNAAVTASRLGYPELSGLDLLELFAFVHPARFAVPTASGLAAALDLPAPGAQGAEAVFLRDAATKLLDTLGDPAWAERHGAWTIAQTLARMRWAWSNEVGRRLKQPARPERLLFTTLPKWEEAPARPRPRDIALPDGAVDARLGQLLGIGAEKREGQRDFARAAAHAFRPRSMATAPNVALAEAGTGIGKTLGYLAPASLWAAEAGGTVWLSTYTKALQRQLDHEAGRAYPDAASKRAKVVVRKGRENYLCLLNLEDAMQGGFSGRPAIFAQLAARWAEYSRDGDMVGGDLPGWLPTLFASSSGRSAAVGGLTDRRGECIYAGCPHYRTCFIERSARASGQADLVIANHALVMITAVRERAEAGRMTRIVFDEGHHLFDAADSTFALHLSAREAIELRSWILGPEKAARGRRRGLAARLSDVTSYDDAGALALEAAAKAARALPSEGWGQRLIGGEPYGPIETLLAAVRAQVHARADAADAGYSLESEVAEVLPAVIDASVAAAAAFEALATPLLALEARLIAVLEEAPDWLDGPSRARLEGAAAGLRLRAQMLGSWGVLLARLGGPADPDFIDWFAVDRVEGREYDVGIHRHWLDPTRPFAKAVLEPAHGVLVTSATQRARGAGADDWRDTEMRTGATHLALPPQRFAVDSPFDYAENARVLIVTDIRRGDIPALAAAYKRLIQAADGGTLGLFTAIARLKAVHARIADPLSRAGLPLFAQHVDPIDTGTLVDIFRADPKASLLGTDALRDGVDVPGHSLRLVVMEGVPWPRPTVLHAARRAAFGGAAYDDLVTQGRLAQAFGRLIRRADDRGIFVLLGPAVPSRLLTAFPGGVRTERVLLDDAVAAVAAMSETTVAASSAMSL